MAIRLVILSICLFLISCSEGIIPHSENCGIHTGVTNDQGEVFFWHGLRHVPNTWYMKTFDTVNGKVEKADCGLWGDTQMFLRAERDSAGIRVPVRNERITVQWCVFL